MRLHRALFLVAFTFGLGACTDEISDVRSAVRRADLEVADHYATIAASASLADARAEVGRHADIIGTDLQDIRVNLDDSEASCDEDDLDWVWDEVVTVERRIDDYLDEAADVTRMDQMIDAAGGYRDDMEVLLDSIDRRLDRVDCL